MRVLPHHLQELRNVVAELVNKYLAWVVSYQEQVMFAWTTTTGGVAQAKLYVGEVLEGFSVELEKCFLVWASKRKTL